MRTFLLILLSFGFLSFVGGKEKNDLEKQGIKGKVKSLTISTFKAKLKIGKVRKGDLVERLDFKFDSAGNMVEEIQYSPNLQFKMTFKYDTKNRPIEDCLYKADGGISERTIFKYDSEGYKIEEDHLGINNSLKFKGIFKNDSKGNLIEEDSYDSSGKMEYKSVIKWDDKGNPIENYHYKRDSLFEKITYGYDEKNQMTEKVYYDKNNKITRKGLFKYNTSGNLCEEAYYKKGTDFEGQRKHTYENNDEHGNWLKKTNFYAPLATLDSKDITPILAPGKPFEIVERNIGYYP